MSKEVIRWDRGFEPVAKTFGEMCYGFILTCCDCGLQHYVRFEKAGLMLYPFRPQDFEYPLCHQCNKFMGMGRKCRGSKIASYEYLLCEEFKEKNKE